MLLNFLYVHTKDLVEVTRPPVEFKKKHHKTIEK